MKPLLGLFRCGDVADDGAGAVLEPPRGPGSGSVTGIHCFEMAHRGMHHRQRTRTALGILPYLRHICTLAISLQYVWGDCRGIAQLPVACGGYQYAHGTEKLFLKGNEFRHASEHLVLLPVLRMVPDRAAAWVAGWHCRDSRCGGIEELI